jgi:hypothetical protein
MLEKRVDTGRICSPKGILETSCKDRSEEDADMKRPETFRYRASALARFAAVALALAAIVGTVPSAIADDWKAVRFGHVSLQVPTWCQMAAYDAMTASCRRSNDNGFELIMVFSRRLQASVERAAQMRQNTPAQRQAAVEDHLQDIATRMAGADPSYRTTSHRFYRVTANALPRGVDSCIRHELAQAHTEESVAADKRFLTCGVLSEESWDLHTFQIEVAAFHEAGGVMPFPDFENRAARILRSAAFRNAN